MRRIVAAEEADEGQVVEEGVMLRDHFLSQGFFTGQEALRGGGVTVQDALDNM